MLNLIGIQLVSEPEIKRKSQNPLDIIGETPVFGHDTIDRELMEEYPDGIIPSRTTLPHLIPKYLAKQKTLKGGDAN